MTALVRNWIAGSAVAAAVSLAVASLVLRETSRARLGETPVPRVALAGLDRKAPTPQGAPAPGSGRTELAFDIARVEPGGAAVVAGHGPSRTKVQLLDGQRLVDEVRSDDTGQFVFVPPPLPAGGHVLRLKAAGAQSKTVRIEVPGLVAGQPAPADPSVPSRVLAETPAASEAGEAGSATPSIETVTPVAMPAGAGDISLPETVPAGAVAATTVAEAIPGSYPPGPAANPARFAPVRRSMAPRRTTSATAAATRPIPPPLRLVARIRVVAPPAQRLPLSRYSLASARPGHAWSPARSAAVGQQRRAGSPSFGTPATHRTTVVSGRGSIRYGGWRGAAAAPPFVRGPPPTATSAPFVRASGRLPVAPWQATVWPPREASAASARPPVPSSTAAPGVRVVVVQPGDTLWRISERAYGSGFAFVRVVQANGAGVRDPQVIVAGQRLILPGVPGRTH